MWSIPIIVLSTDTPISKGEFPLLAQFRPKPQSSSSIFSQNSKDKEKTDTEIWNQYLWVNWLCNKGVWQCPLPKPVQPGRWMIMIPVIISCELGWQISIWFNFNFLIPFGRACSPFFLTYSPIHLASNVSYLRSRPLQKIWLTSSW